ncbi:MAG: copper chaperone PCu(A)C [Pseudomonadota bacterium]
MLRPFLIALLLLSAGSTAGAEERVGSIAIPVAWSRATPGPTAAVYLELRNEGAEADRLLGAVSPIAERVEIHEHHSDGGIMSMTAIPELVLPPGETVTLAPGRLHLMLFEVRQPLKPGDRFALTLQFAHAGTAQVQVVVGGAGAVLPPS